METSLLSTPILSVGIYIHYNAEKELSFAKKNNILATKGIYALNRNPIYTSIIIYHLFIGFAFDNWLFFGSSIVYWFYLNKLLKRGKFNEIIWN